MRGGECATRSIHYDRKPCHGRSHAFDKRRHFENTAASCYNVFSKKNSVVGKKGESSPELESSRWTLSENVTYAELARELIPYEDAAHSRRKNDRRIPLPHNLGNFLRDLLSDARNLRQACALKVLGAVEAAAQKKMAFEQSPGAVQKLECFAVVSTFVELLHEDKPFSLSG